MNILSIYIGDHHSSFTFMENNIIKEYFLEERLSRIKSDWDIKNIENKIKKYYVNDKIYIIISVYNVYEKKINIAFELKEKILYKNPFLKKRIIILEYNHHLYHAYCGFYNSNFDKAICIISDGIGSKNDLHCQKFLKKHNFDEKLFFETESIFLLEKNKKPEVIYKKYFSIQKKIFMCRDFEKNKKNFKNFKFKKDYFEVVSEYKDVGPATKYGLFLFYLNYPSEAAGKVMGLGQYKGYEDKLPKEYCDDKIRHILNNANELQKNTQQRIIDLIKKYSNEVDTKNIVISGGYGLNCVANYEYLKYIDASNLWIDPICFDAGQSIGAIYYYQNNNK